MILYYLTGPNVVTRMDIGEQEIEICQFKEHLAHIKAFGETGVKQEPPMTCQSWRMHRNSPFS